MVWSNATGSNLPPPNWTRTPNCSASFYRFKSSRSVVWAEPPPTSAAARCGLLKHVLTRTLPAPEWKEIVRQGSLCGLLLRMACKRLTTYFRGGTNGPVSSRLHPDENPAAGLF